jgi:DNA polymerase-3 subunit alpha
MDNYGLKPEEQELLKPIVGLAYGICESQEKFMQLVQLPECGGFDLSWADRLRKSIAKKNPAEYEQLTKEFFENAKEKKLSYNLCNYVWNVLVATSRGYGFNASHTLAYSLVALQEMNLAYRFPIIFWNTACLITDSGGNEEDPEEAIEEVVDIYEPEDFEEFEYIDAPDKKTKIKKKRTKTTDYKKIAIAISKMKQAGINIEPPNINTSTYTFTPDVENNKIIFGLSGILSVGEDVYCQILEVDDNESKLKLSIKNINYKANNKNSKVKESRLGFLPLKNNLNKWVADKISEIKKGSL